MSVESHLAELERRHAALEAEIHTAQGHPATDNLELVAMKRRKLLLKEQILKLRTGETIH